MPSRSDGRWLILLALVGCARDATPDDCACDDGQLCVLDGPDASCVATPGDCSDALSTCDASDACEQDLCGDAWAGSGNGTFVLSCDPAGPWVSCE